MIYNQQDISYQYALEEQYTPSVPFLTIRFQVLVKRCQVKKRRKNAKKTICFWKMDKKATKKAHAYIFYYILLYYVIYFSLIIIPEIILSH